MLEVFAAAGMNQQVWDALSSRAELPCEADVYFLPNGVTPPHGECGRRYRRFELRQRAVLARDERLHAVYAKDASRVGIGLISPVQLFPLERIELLLEGPGSIELEVQRCRRLKAKCYECGAVFANSDEASAVYRQLVQRLGSS